MKNVIYKAFFLSLIVLPGMLLSGNCLAQNKIIKHQLDVLLEPQSHQLQVIDKITLPKGAPRKLEFYLHQGLNPQIVDKNIRIKKLSSSKQSLWSRYTFVLPEGVYDFTLKYSGKIYHSLDAYGKQQARANRSTPGLISDEGIFLASSSFWYPQFVGYDRLQFTLKTVLPEAWKAVSQGERIEQSSHSEKSTSIWHSATPQEDIYLIAAPFIEYSQQQGNVLAQVFLREADEKLANNYLHATEKYIEMYQTLLGAYPYGKFALVENFWETGYGMPSFTLLGSKVIRLPFILYSSYPHEILHNWWGNGVYVDFASGNWSEGLTSYLADHLIKQQQGRAVVYRQQSLQKYSDYAANNRDFPLKQFKGRHNSATQAVGYGKTLMLMHMMRQQLGDKAFILALQQFYQQHLFEVASFDDLRLAFEQASGQSLHKIFEQWVNRTGAPVLKLTQSGVEPCDAKYCLVFSLQQTQLGDVYQLQVPIAITLAGEKQAKQQVLNMQQKKQIFKIVLPVRPERLDIDPEFDLFRILAPAEMPPAFTQLFGARQMLLVLPDKANKEMKKAWQAFATNLARMGPDEVTTVWDSSLKTLPEDQPVVVLGWDNLHANTITDTMLELGAHVEKNQMTIANKVIPRRNHAVALSTRFNDFPRTFIAADLAASLSGLGRKLPHYHKYSYLAFSGEAPVNQLKGRWPVLQSPMTAFFSDNAKRGKLAPRRALIMPAAQYAAKQPTVMQPGAKVH